MKHFPLSARLARSRKPAGPNGRKTSRAILTCLTSRVVWLGVSATISETLKEGIDTNCDLAQQPSTTATRKEVELLADPKQDGDSKALIAKL